VTQAGGTVIGAGCLISRGNVMAEQLETDRYTFLLEYRIPAWPESACKLCQSGVPINTRFAHGSDYLARRAAKQ
jgi:orotate phosphoribosyltransferase